jgi:hypothetical protein
MSKLQQLSMRSYTLCDGVECFAIAGVPGLQHTSCDNDPATRVLANQLDSRSWCKFSRCDSITTRPLTR